MMEATVVRSFRRSDTKQWVKRGQLIQGAESYVRELERIGSVRNVAALPGAPEVKAPPQTAVGTPSSASPAAPASPPQTSKKSASGGKKRSKKKAAR
jgi:hypothetical protein